MVRRITPLADDDRQDGCSPWRPPRVWLPKAGTQKLAPTAGAPTAEASLLDQLGQLSQRIFHGAPEAAPRVAEAKEAAEAKPDLTA